MRITYLSNAIIPSRTANSINVMKMCSAFTSLGHNVTLVVPDREPKQTVNDVYEFYGVSQRFPIRVLRWLPVRGRSYFYAIHAAILAKRTNASLVYTRSVFSALCAAVLRLEVMLELHTACKGGQATEMRILAKQRRLKKVVCISAALAERIIADFPNVEGRVLVAHDGADLPGEQEAIRLHPYLHGLNAGYVGHLYPGKGMEMIAELANHCPNIHFHVVGGMQDDINRWTAQLSEASNVTFHGFVPPSKVDRYLRSFDILLAPYGSNVNSYGGNSDIVNWMSPLKIFEYMAAGKAIICADLVPLREVLTHGKTALLCKPGSIQDWVKSLELLVSDQALRRRLGVMAKYVFEKNYSWLARAAKVVGVNSADESTFPR